MWTLIGAAVQVVFGGLAELYRDWRHRQDLDELARRRLMDDLRRRNAAELRRLQELGYEELQREVAREIGPAGVAAGRTLLERLRGGARAAGAAAT